MTTRHYFGGTDQQIAAWMAAHQQGSAELNALHALAGEVHEARWVLTQAIADLEWTLANGKADLARGQVYGATFLHSRPAEVEAAAAAYRTLAKQFDVAAHRHLRAVEDEARAEHARRAAEG